MVKPGATRRDYNRSIKYIIRDRKANFEKSCTGKKSTFNKNAYMNSDNYKIIEPINLKMRKELFETQKIMLYIYKKEIQII